MHHAPLDDQVHGTGKRQQKTTTSYYFSNVIPLTLEHFSLSSWLTYVNVGIRPISAWLILAGQLFQTCIIITKALQRLVQLSIFD